MGHALLLNPFKQAAAEPTQDNRQDNRQDNHQEHNRAGTRATPVCSHCQSDDIVCSATVQWSNESQEWQLANTFDLPAHCNSCRGSSALVWLPLN